MRISESSIENLRGLGYTEDEARFLYIVATHSGYFTARQYLRFTGTKSGQRNMSLTQKLLGRGHANARLLLRNGRVYRLYSEIIYRAAARQNLRNRRQHSEEHIRTKLVILDFVLAHLDYRYLETEADKIDYFCKELGLKRETLPSKRYAGAIRERTTDRYFVDRFPMFFVPNCSPSPVVTFSFVDPGLLSLAAFASHVFHYHPLLAAVPRVNLVYVATRTTHFEAARKLFEAMAPAATNPDPGTEGLRYFHNRYLWESKQYAKLSHDQIEALNEAKRRYTDPRIETLFQPFMNGQIPVNVVTEQFRKLAPKREVFFRTELVDGQTTLFEPNLPPKKRQQAETMVTGPVHGTFSSAFQPAFQGGMEQPEEN